jgi:N-glycosylase/DNA lyase
MEDLLCSIRSLQRKVEIKRLIDERLKEFKKVGESSGNEIFKELCFCLLTAKFNAEKSIRIQRELGDNFLKESEAKLAEELKRLGHRYPKIRAKYIVEARKHMNIVVQAVKSFNNPEKLREWLTGKIRGLGYKEASHFLRNIGYRDLAILDFHVLGVLEKYGIIIKPKTLTRRKYLEIEQKLRKLAKRLGLTLAELDLYLWYLETGKILK